MSDFLRAFERGPDGSWTCLAKATYVHSEGRIQVMPGTRFTPGTSIMGVDLVAWLERQLQQIVPPSAAKN